MRDDWCISSWLQPISSEIAASYDHNAGSYHKINTLIFELFAYFESAGLEQLQDLTDDVIPEWVDSPGYNAQTQTHYDPAPTTQRNRLWAARLALKAARQLGAPIDANALVRGAVIAEDGGRKTKLLTDTQLDRVKTHADPGTRPSRRSVAVTLSLAGAKPAEIPAVCLADIDLNVGTVRLGTGDNARVNSLSEWGCRTIRRRIEHTPPDSRTEPLCVRPATSPIGAARSIRTQLSQLMRQAGIGHIDGISGMSIRYTAARKVFESAGIEAAARFLGTGSLDTAAAAVGHTWRSDDG
ncbi:hypothetical protein [Candidatus Poriferisodalis sp.]|uniref:hypothetical protein n=1 Tax=Candidatus Poriferisodalis sp. TaxID=3101277 RepID=UPI003B023311